MKAKATLDGTSLKLYINNDLVREINSPIHGNAYTFRIKKEEYNFIYEKKFSRHILYLYPITDFKPNVITTETR
jgi:hypothetical protein